MPSPQPSSPSFSQVPFPTSAILAAATVPEHSVLFMQAMSGGTPLYEGGFLFFTADDWLMGIGYPLAAAHSRAAACSAPGPALAPPSSAAFETALANALSRTGACACWAIGPALPPRLQAHITDRDNVYTLDIQAPVPAALRAPLTKAAALLTVTEGRTFTPAHRRLWAEFLSNAHMKPNVRELYARTEAALDAASASRRPQPGLPLSHGVPSGSHPHDAPLLDLRLLSAHDTQGNLAAALLLDYSPKDFCAYIIGAHSRLHYTAHATDLLFAAMLERCRGEAKAYIHLGLGVNQGIARFKRKWGGTIALPYEMAAWTEPTRAKGAPGAHAASNAKKEITTAMRGMLQAPTELSKRQIFESLPKQRPFAMIWEVRKGNAVSYLCGTAHFFCYSFEFAFRDLFASLDTIIFEGPLDEGFLAAVEHAGRTPHPGTPALLDALAEPERTRLERVVHGPQGLFPRLFGLVQPCRVDIRHLLTQTRPWFAFFSLWAAFLERQGWNQSVDLEAWHTAKDMGKAIIGMENLEEQLDSLEVIPLARIISFLRKSEAWPRYMNRNIKAYLNGDLFHMMGSSIEFPSRTEQVIDRRDIRFHQRMLPFMEAGNCAAFVGTAHLIGLRPMLEKNGFTVRQVHLSPLLKLRAWMKNRW